MSFGGAAEVRQEHPDWRELGLDLSIASGVALVVVTESLGALAWLATWPVRAVWLVWLALLVAVVRHQARLSLSKVHQSGTAVARSSRIVLAGLGLILVLVGLSAFFAPPNAIDSLNYHMSRVVNWQERHSVADYPAGYLPQLYQPPWAEFAILNLQGRVWVVDAWGDGAQHCCDGEVAEHHVRRFGLDLSGKESRASPAAAAYPGPIRCEIFGRARRLPPPVRSNLYEFFRRPRGPY